MKKSEVTLKVYMMKNLYVCSPGYKKATDFVCADRTLIVWVILDGR